MAEVVKIVLTGGPCGGKTAALEYISEELKKLNIPTITISESASRLLSAGKTPENVGSYEFHRELFEMQLAEENEKTQLAKEMNCEKAVLLFDRGLLDSRAYVTEDEFAKYAGLHNLNEDVIRNSYDAVFHLVTSADGAEEYYGKETNIFRREESLEKAREVDTNVMAVWTGTPHLRVIDNSTDFDTKLKRLLKEVVAFLGIPKPLEIERKFLIEYPDIEFLNSIKTCRRISITQAYLTTPDEGYFRIRRRGDGDKAVYIKTVKIKISDIKRIEIENYISKEQYDSYLAQRQYVTGIISKDRYCIVDNNTYYELDVYPFWSDRATIEIELLSENQPYQLPSFVKLVREVTSEPNYRNLALAQKYGKP